MNEILSSWDLANQWFEAYGSNILIAALIFYIGRWLAVRVSHLLETVLRKGKSDPVLTSFLKNLSYYTLLVAVVIAVLGQLGVPTTSFLAILGTAGLAVGLALKDNLSNLSSGVMLLFTRPFGIGDVVEVAGVRGKVQALNIFETILHTPDNQRIILPNSRVIGTSIKNMSANPIRRIDLSIGIGYQDDIRKAKEVLGKLLAQEERILPDPAPVVAVFELAESSVNLVVRPWVKAADYWDVRFSLTENIKLSFDQEGISFPFPQRVVHMYTQDSKPEQL